MLIVSLNLFSGAVLMAQPGPKDGGVLVHAIVVRGVAYKLFSGKSSREELVRVPNAPIQSEHCILNEQGKVRYKLTTTPNPFQHDLLQLPYNGFSFFLPAQVNNKAASYQRILLIYRQDTMTIDFSNIPQQSFGERYEMEQIYFMPGHFKVNYLNEVLRMHDAAAYYYRALGITPETDTALQRIGVLQYSPPADRNRMLQYSTTSIKPLCGTRYNLEFRIPARQFGEYELNTLQVQRSLDSRWIPQANCTVSIDSNVVHTNSIYSRSVIKVQLRFADNAVPGDTLRVAAINSWRDTLFSIFVYSQHRQVIRDTVYQLFSDAGNEFVCVQRSSDVSIAIEDFGTDQAVPKVLFYRSSSENTDNKASYLYSDRISPTGLMHEEMIRALATAKVQWNGQPFTGVIYWAFPFYDARVQSGAIPLHDIYSITYKNGKVVTQQINKAVQ